MILQPTTFPSTPIDVNWEGQQQEKTLCFDIQIGIAIYVVDIIVQC